MDEVLGKTFGRWTVLKKLPPAKHRPSDTGVRVRYLARCICGLEKPVWIQDLQRGRRGCRSADCMADERAYKRIDVVIDVRVRGASREIRDFGHILKLDMRELPRLTREEREKFARQKLQAELRGEGIDADGAPSWNQGREWTG